MNFYRKCVGITVFNSRGKIWVGERSNINSEKKWQMPQGGVDSGEKTLNAASRELFEETGIKIIEPEFYGLITETSPKDYNWISYIYSVEIDLINKPNSNEGVLEWVDYKKILELPTPKTEGIIYEYILKKKKLYNFHRL